jgi:TonB family protein
VKHLVARPAMILVFAFGWIVAAWPALVRAQQAQSAQSAEQQAVPTSGKVAPLHVAEDVMASKLIHRVQPVYPQIALAAHVSGTVVFHAVIAEDGRVKSLQFISGPALLEHAAANAVYQSRYQPTLLNGEPVQVDTTVSVDFVLYPVSADPAIMEQSVISRTPPVYPERARADGIQGVVVVRVTVAKDGHVRDAKALSGPGPLRGAATKAVKQWKYKPYLLHGSAVEVTTTVSIPFTLQP